jgi:hypothetical protein
MAAILDIHSGSLWLEGAGLAEEELIMAAILDTHSGTGMAGGSWIGGGGG